MKKIMCIWLGLFAGLAPAQTLKVDPTTLRLPTNTDYQLKFIADLSAIKPVDNWYPAFNKVANQNSDQLVVNDTSNQSIVVNNEFLYRLVGFLKYDKYSKNFLQSVSQLRLCRTKLDDGINWDCSTLINEVSSARYGYDSDQQYLIPSADGDNIIIHYHNGKRIVLAEYSTFTNFVADIDIPQDILNTFDSYLPNSYYNSQRLFTSIGMINFNNNTVNLVRDSMTYLPRDKCYYSQSTAITVYDKYYTLNQDRVFNVELFFKLGMVFESQLGETNADFASTFTSTTYNKHVAARGANELLILSSGVTNKNSLPSRTIYAITDNSDGKQPWKILTLAETLPTAKTKAKSAAFSNSFDFNTLNLFSSAQNAYVSIQVNSAHLNNKSGTQADVRQYLYAIIGKK